VDAGGGYTVVATEANVSPGVVFAVFNVCNGTVAFLAKGDLKSDLFRRRVANGAQEYHPGVDRAALTAALIRLCEGLPGEVQRRRRAIYTAAQLDSASGPCVAGASGLPVGRSARRGRWDGCVTGAPRGDDRGRAERSRGGGITDAWCTAS
jgi:hypothetical protein